jgi:hypothetical protein
VGLRRVLDSAPLEDAVATQDTVTMLRGLSGGLLPGHYAPCAGSGWTHKPLRRPCCWRR